jgi:2-amino-4-hydroxy-6-hydroxymethyldihydropteridine diphosphokinase
VSSTAVLSLGSNLGDRAALLDAAVEELRSVAEVLIVSEFVETPALKLSGIDREAPAYLNAVVIVRTDLAPEALLDAVNAIEANNGRVREERWGDRTLDIDLVTFDEIIMDTPRLTLPHPRAAERAFVLVPWLDADPHAVLPGFGPVETLVAGLDADIHRYERPGSK